MQIPFGLSSYRRGPGDLPELPVVNMYAEAAPTEDGKVALQSRPGLDDREADMGGGPVRGLFKRDGVLGGALFGVSGSAIYRGTASLGPIGGSGPVSLAGYENLLFANAGKEIRAWDSDTLSTVAFPDGADVVKVLVAASRLVAIRRDTGKFYWTAPLGSTIAALDFATAENQPDRLLDALFIDDVLHLFGTETTEPWMRTGDPSLPFTPIGGRVIEKGIRATGCATSIGSTFAWVTNENQVCLSDENTVLSEPGLQERIEAAAEVSLFTLLLDGVEFLVLRLDDETQVWHNGTWAEWASYGEANWIPRCYAGGVFGSAVDGKTLAWGAGHQDLGGVLERRFRAGFSVDGGGVRINNLRLRCNTGQTPFLTGDYAEPHVEMQLSDDAGQTWSAWDAVPLGAQGDYRAQPEWRALGLASQPGFLAEFRTTDPVPFRVSAVLVNESVGGR